MASVPPEGELDAETVALAQAIIAQRSGKFDPSSHRDCYQEALPELIEAKLKGIRLEPRAAKAYPGRRKATTDRPQPALFLLLSGARKRRQARCRAGHFCPKEGRRLDRAGPAGFSQPDKQLR